VQTSNPNVLQLKLPLLQAHDMRPHTWKEQIRIQESILSAQKRLNGKTTAWFWGMDCSPLGDLMALNFNILPTDVPVYFIPSDRRSSLLMAPIKFHESSAFALPQPIDINKSSGRKKKSSLGHHIFPS
jgi:hypothetical protein